MKRVLLLITFFVGLIPNIIDLSIESIYEVKGQGFYDEFPGEKYPPCNNCGGVCIEVGFFPDAIIYCPDCQFYCETCKEAFYRNGPDDYETIAIHESSHKTDNENEEEDDENNNDNENNNDDENNNENQHLVKRYICLSCLYSNYYTEEERIIHTNKYGHRYFKEVLLLVP